MRLSRAFAFVGLTALFTFGVVRGDGCSAAYGAGASPLVSSVLPGTVVAGDSPTITVIGANFQPQNFIQLDGAALATSFVSATTLRATMPATKTATAGTHTVAVCPGGTSPCLTPFALQVNNPKPVIESITPLFFSSGVAPGQLKVTGTGIIPGVTQLKVGDQVIGTIGADGSVPVDPVARVVLGSVGTPSITAVNATFGGGTSPAFALTATQASPGFVISSVTAALVAGVATGPSITVAGTGFVNGDKVVLNGTTLATTFGSSVSLSASPTSASIAHAGKFYVTVERFAGGPAPTAVAEPVSVTISSPRPQVAMVTQETSAVSETSTITIIGAGFTADSRVTIDGLPCTTTYKDVSTLTAAFSPSGIGGVGTVPIIVVNPGPGGGTSPPWYLMLDDKDASAAPSKNTDAGASESNSDILANVTLTSDDLLAGRCKTAICPAGIVSPGWLGIEPLVELPIGKSFTFNSGGLADYVNSTGVGATFTAGLRVWMFRDWVSLGVYLSQPVTPQDSRISIPGSSFQYPATYVHRPYPGIALGFLYDVLWVGLDRDELHNGSDDGTSSRNPAYPPNALVSGVWTWTVAIQPITAFRTGIGTALSQKSQATGKNVDAGQ